MRRKWPLLALLALLAVIGFGVREATAPPIVRTLTVALPHWPAGARPVRLLLIADLHASWPDMTRTRIARTMRRLAALKPDIVVVAGDFYSSGKLFSWALPVADATEPLALLQPPLGKFAVYGNHDHIANIADLRRALRRAGVTPFANRARQVGPLVLGGIDDATTGHEDIEGTVAEMTKLDGAMVAISHGWQPFRFLPPGITLLLSGHSHCSQIAVPRLRAHYPCGITRRGAKTMVTTAGLGTSNIPLRYGAPPDAWLITLGP